MVRGKGGRCFGKKKPRTAQGVRGVRKFMAISICRERSFPVRCSKILWHGKKARAGLVRALRAHTGSPADDALWVNDVSREYRKLLMAGAVEKVSENVGRDGRTVRKVVRKGIRKGLGTGASRNEVEQNVPATEEIPFARVLRCRVRYFTDGAVIGSKTFVNEAFANARERFTERRKDGARRLRGDAAAAAGLLWSLRDLRKGI